MAERLPRAVQEGALFRAHRSRPRAFDVGRDAQPMLSVHEIAKCYEGRAAIGGVGRALFQRRACQARLAALEDFIGLDVAPFAVQIGSALHEVTGAARAQQREPRRYTEYASNAFAHSLRIRRHRRKASATLETRLPGRTPARALSPTV